MSRFARVSVRYFAVVAACVSIMACPADEEPLEFGAPCETEAGCRSGLCVDDASGRGACACIPDAAACERDYDCCSSQCDDSGKCVAPSAGETCDSATIHDAADLCAGPSFCRDQQCCSPTSDSCATGDDCCSKNCTGGSCQCSVSKEDCTDTGGCCADLRCWRKYGAAQVGYCCADIGQACSDVSDCCGDTEPTDPTRPEMACEQGTCQFVEPRPCKAKGDFCIHDAKCCSNSCAFFQCR